MGIKRYPGHTLLGNYAVTGTLRVDASAYITGPLNAATGLLVSADASIARLLDCATGISICGVTSL